MKLLRYLYYKVFIRFVVSIVLGLNVRHRERLPQKGPAIVVANHNSHLDTMVLINLLPSRLLPIIQPVAAMDYFLRSRLLSWFALNIVGILPISRQKEAGQDPLADCGKALAEGKILIFFPEGSRGEPERMTKLKKGIFYLAEKHPEVPVYPIYMHGLGKALPKGEALLVPFFCDVFVGAPMQWSGDREAYLAELDERLHKLAAEGHFPEWD
jgi:1-acyl-sn-glycerol-3-phosphate acyltransferase